MVKLATTPEPGADEYWPSMGEFKNSLCDENRLIADALRTQCQQWLKPPILDVGAGLGDIAAVAFPDSAAVLLDSHRVPEVKSRHHTFVRGDFFRYVPKPSDHIRTILLCHVLQYLDDDWEKFRLKIADLEPETVIAVTNDNDEEFGRLVDWARASVPGSNPEESRVQLDMAHYRLRQTAPIRATFTCPNFGTMAKNLVIGLFDEAPTAETISITTAKLRELLNEPRMTINQTIYCYEKNQ